MANYFPTESLNQAQFEILFDDLSDNNLLPYNKLPVLNKSLLTESKVIIKAINELKGRIDGIDSQFLSFGQLYDSLIGDSKSDATLKENLLKIDDNILKAIYKIYEMSFGDPSVPIDVSQLGTNIYACLIKLDELIKLKADKTYVDDELNKKSDKANTYTKEEVDQLISTSPGSGSGGSGLTRFVITPESSTARFTITATKNTVTVTKRADARYTITVPDDVELFSMNIYFCKSELANTNRKFELMFEMGKYNTSQQNLLLPTWKVYDVQDAIGSNVAGLDLVLFSIEGARELEYEPKYMTFQQLLDTPSNSYTQLVLNF